MTAVIKSGTKQYHASGWEFLRNDAFDAKNYFTGKTPLKFHTFGFNVGGPVDFWAKEHKTFFFYNMEWRRLIQGDNIKQDVPSTDWYTGTLPTPSSGVAGVSNFPVLTVPNISTAFLYRNCGGVAPPGITPGSPFPQDGSGNQVIPSCISIRIRHCCCKKGSFLEITESIQVTCNPSSLAAITFQHT